MSFWHDGGVTKSTLMLVVKTTNCNSELWVKSLYRVRASEKRRLLKRLTPLR